MLKPPQTGGALKQQARLWSPKGEDVIKTYDVSRMLSLNIRESPGGQKRC